MNIHSWFMDVHKWIFVQYMYQNTWKSGKLVRSGRFFRENRWSDDINFTRNLKISKLHINNPLFSLELVAMACVSSQQHPARNRPLKLTPIRRNNWGVSEADSVTAINTEVVNKCINIYIYISKCYYIWIIYLLNIYPKNSETGNLNLLNETHGKKCGFGPSRLQVLKCHWWNCHISNSIYTK